ncbi:hypothetical protein [Methanolobus sp.]|uniref:hypothetical protein n=1 Tax=Methanolobus sp. TaxID=1874737 RepID=UPI0025F89A3A|nr:hypothetical protein [Methanolobus sp.]
MKCKYYDNCDKASSTAKTCVEHGGGSYCGAYRVFAALSPSISPVPFPAQPVAMQRKEILV